ncbi:MAG: hypothetical protein WDN28_02590 [Chthoniobacter sp.]
MSVRSFNAGVAAMVPPEDGYYLDQILRGPHRRLRWVVLEIMPLGAQADPTLAGTGRFTYWHDWPRTRLLTQFCLGDCAKIWRGRIYSVVAEDSRLLRVARRLVEECAPLCRQLFEHRPR